MPSQLLDAVNVVARAVRDAGGRALLVGGCVRDALIGEEPKDYDIEVFSLPTERLIGLLSERFELDLVGSSFGVVKLRHLDIDIAVPRHETKLGLGHKAFETECDPFLSVRDAAARRDFTVNAIYRDPLTGEIVDPWGGQSDLQRKVMRHVSDHFREDPLRVLRGMQFAARFDLVPDEATVAICRSMESEGLPPERLMGEWSKLLVKGREISRGLNFLKDVGWLKYYPELEALVGCRQDREWHPEGDVWAHTLCCLDAFARRRDAGDFGDQENLIVGLAVLCHDFGKPAATFYDQARGRIRSPGHDEAGVEPTLSFLRRLTNEERILKEVPPLVRLHMRPYSLWKQKAGENAVRRLAAEVVRIDRLIRVAEADDEGRPPFPSEREPLEWLASESERLKVADSAPKPLVFGRDLIALGHKPSVRFGVILKACYEAQLDGKIATREEGVEFARLLASDENGQEGQ